MIRYSLKCPEQHQFDSWFQSTAAFDTVSKAGHLACPICGSAQIDKALMAPAVRPAREAAPALGPPGLSSSALPPSATRPQTPDLTTPTTDLEKAMAAMRREVETNSDYVGLNFAAEARAMHDGDAPQRPIYGEARPEDARRLIEDGVPVAPLPFMPQRKVN